MLNKLFNAPIIGFPLFKYHTNIDHVRPIISTSSCV